MQSTTAPTKNNTLCPCIVIGEQHKKVLQKPWLPPLKSKMHPLQTVIAPPYTVSIKIRVICHVSPHETQNPEEFVTEVCYPVRKKK